MLIICQHRNQFVKMQLLSLPFLRFPFPSFRIGLSLLFARVGSANPKIRSYMEKLLRMKPVTQQSAEAVSKMFPSQQLDDRQKWSSLRAAFSYFPGQWWVGLMGVFSPGEVLQRALFPQATSSFLAPLQAVSLSAKSSCGLSCSEPSYLLPRAWSYKMLRVVGFFCCLPWMDHSIPQIWALRHFKKRLFWWGTAIGV